MVAYIILLLQERRRKKIVMRTTGGKRGDKMWKKGGDIGDKRITSVNDEGVGWSSPWYKCFFSLVLRQICNIYNNIRRKVTHSNVLTTCGSLASTTTKFSIAWFSTAGYFI